MNRADQFDATMKAWANDPRIPTLEPITTRPADLDRAIRAMSTDEIEALLEANRAR